MWTIFGQSILDIWREPFLAPGSDTSPGFYSQFSSTRTRAGSWNGHDNGGDDGNL